MTRDEQEAFHRMREIMLLKDHNMIKSKEENELFKLQYRFGCLPTITQAQMVQLEKLRRQMRDSPLSEKQQSEFERLSKLPLPYQEQQPIQQNR